MNWITSPNKTPRCSRRQRRQVMRLRLKRTRLFTRCRGSNFQASKEPRSRRAIRLCLNDQPQRIRRPRQECRCHKAMPHWPCNHRPKRTAGKSSDSRRIKIFGDPRPSASHVSTRSDQGHAHKPTHKTKKESRHTTFEHSRDRHPRKRTCSWPENLLINRACQQSVLARCLYLHR